MVYKIQKNVKEPQKYTEEEMLDDILSFSKKLTLWGSNKVIKKWLAFRKMSQAENKNPTDNNLANKLLNDNLDKLNTKVEFKKIAGLDVGLNNIASIFVNDKDTKSIIISGKELISYNCNFNKRLAKINNEIANEVIQYKEIVNKEGNKQLIPEEYSKKGKVLQNRKSQLFERRKLYMDDYMQKLSKKITNLNYLYLDLI